MAHLEGTNILTEFQKYALAVSVFLFPMIGARDCSLLRLVQLLRLRCACAGSLIFAWHNQFVSRLGMRARNALTSAIYRFVSYASVHCLPVANVCGGTWFPIAARASS